MIVLPTPICKFNQLIQIDNKNIQFYNKYVTKINDNYMRCFLTRIIMNSHELLLFKVSHIKTYTEKFMIIRDNSCLKKNMYS